VFFLVCHLVYCIFPAVIEFFLCSLMAFDCQGIKKLLTYLPTYLLTFVYDLQTYARRLHGVSMFSDFRIARWRHILFSILFILY